MCTSTPVVALNNCSAESFSPVGLFVSLIHWLLVGAGKEMFASVICVMFNAKERFMGNWKELDIFTSFSPLSPLLHAII